MKPTHIIIMTVSVLVSSILYTGYRSRQFPDQKSEKPLSLKDYRKYANITPETDKSEVNDVWYGSIYRNKKYHLRIQFPDGWERDKGMSINTLARAIDREKGITLSVAIQHHVVEVNDDQEIFDSYSLEEFKSLFNKLLNTTNQTSADDLDIQKGHLNNLPAYIMTYTSKQSSLDQTVTFLMKQVHCLRNSKIYTVSIVIPLEFYDADMEQIFRSFVDSFKFEFH